MEKLETKDFSTRLYGREIEFVKLQAKKKGMSVSKYLSNLVANEIDRSSVSGSGMNEDERSRLQALVTGKRLKPGAPCPMDGCKGHLKYEEKAFLDFTGKKQPLYVAALMCSRTKCKFKGIFPEKYTKQIEAWQKGVS